MTLDRATLARSFDAWAGEYDRYRPGYPDELFETIRTRLRLPARPLVVDLGAGTGRASLAMASLGWRVTAVEPGKPMLDQLRASAANNGLIVSTVQASAEETGVAPASADLATAAQSFHWFDKDAALTEMARIVRPGGGIALFWNVRDAERSPFVADYHGLLEKWFGEADAGHRLQAGRGTEREETRAALERHAGFGDVELVTMEHDVMTTATAFIGMAFTASYIRSLPAEDQDRFRIELGGALGRHGHTGDEPFVLPYRVDLWIARRHGS